MADFYQEGRRLVIFKILFGFLFVTLCVFLVYRQFFQYHEFKEQERKQGQRRIIRPGPRGDIFDRNGKLLIGNKAHFAAKLHIGSIDQEIWEKKKKLRNTSIRLLEELKAKPFLEIEQLISFGFQQSEVKDRFIRFSGKAKLSNTEFERVSLFFQTKRIDVEQDSRGNWHSEIKGLNPNRKITLQVRNSQNSVNVNLANLFKVSFELNYDGDFKKILPITETPVLRLFFPDEPAWKGVFSSSGSSLGWEAKLAVVQKYTDSVNLLTGRNKKFTLKEVIRHWREKLLLPLELARDLKPFEYAKLIEGIGAHSPIEVQAEAIRHYPFRDLASHVLGYVGSGYEANPQGLSGEDLTTYEIKGRKGKAGLERVWDDHLRGIDGGEIWRVNPDGTRYEQLEKKVSQKGKNLTISIDADLQNIAEKSIEKMISSVAKSRILPDLDWKKTILRRTNQALLGSNEKKVPAQLLLSAFVDAPFPLNGKQASTVAGFQGTPNDAQRLLKILYARGVLAKPNLEMEEFELAPPPLPPGAAVLIDLKSGGILALASKPSYDLSELTPFIPQSVYDQIERREAWLPRAWHPGYAPASPFKLISAIAGYKTGHLEANQTKTCDGIYKGMECHVFPGIHGQVNLEDAISQSCNVYFYRLAEKIGFQNLIETARELGLDQSPVIEVPSLRDKPIVPDPEWKRKKIGVRWTLEDTFNIAIGQGGLRQSPLQMACLVACIATNRKEFKPTLIHQENSSLAPAPPLGIEPKFLNEIIAGMQKATEQGTARRCKIKGISIAGKTGTGQWRNHNMNLNLAWFVGFAPVENPEIAVATLVEGVIPQDHVQGGLTATPIARDLIQAYFEQKDTKVALGKN